MKKDTVFDNNMNVVFCRFPHEVEARLNAKYPDSWAHVMVGETRKMLTVSEYVNREFQAKTVEIIEGALERQSTRPYKGVARRLYAERLTRQIIDLI